MTEVGIPVFNTPGANANAVKELILCGMLLGSRRVVDGINHMKELGEKGQARERVEKDKVRALTNKYAFRYIELWAMLRCIALVCILYGERCLYGVTHHIFNDLFVVFMKGNVWWT